MGLRTTSSSSSFSARKVPKSRRRSCWLGNVSWTTAFCGGMETKPKAGGLKRLGLNSPLLCQKDQTKSGTELPSNSCWMMDLTTAAIGKWTFSSGDWDSVYVYIVLTSRKRISYCPSVRLLVRFVSPIWSSAECKDQWLCFSRQETRWNSSALYRQTLDGNLELSAPRLELLWNATSGQFTFWCR